MNILKKYRQNSQWFVQLSVLCSACGVCLLRSPRNRNFDPIPRKGQFWAFWPFWGFWPFLAFWGKWAFLGFWVFLADLPFWPFWGKRSKSGFLGKWRFWAKSQSWEKMGIFVKMWFLVILGDPWKMGNWGKCEKR